jgi:hypothetical protein
MLLLGDQMYQDGHWLKFFDGERKRYQGWKMIQRLTSQKGKLDLWKI